MARRAWYDGGGIDNSPEAVIGLVNRNKPLVDRSLTADVSDLVPAVVYSKREEDRFGVALGVRDDLVSRWPHDDIEEREREYREMTVEHLPTSHLLIRP